MFQIINLDQIDSTNEEAKRLIKSGEAFDGLVLVAKSQTDGHGRYGRDWCSPEGNLYFSVIIKSDKEVAENARLSFVVGVALVEFVEKMCEATNRFPSLVGGARGGHLDNKPSPDFQPHFSNFQLEECGEILPLPRGEGERCDGSELYTHPVTINLKWPNDLLLNNAKAAGILLESLPCKDGGNWVVIGIGLNVSNSPKDLEVPTTSLSECGIDVAIDEKLLHKLLKYLENEINVWQKGDFQAIRGRWLDRAYMLGRRIDVGLSDRKLSGIFKTIDENGQLQLETDSGVELVSSGEVFFSGQSSG